MKGILILILVCIFAIFPASAAFVNFTPWTQFGDYWESHNDTYTAVQWNSTGSYTLNSDINVTSGIVVAGGAGASGNGGGGAGGVIILSNIVASFGTPIVIGEGGIGNTPSGLVSLSKGKNSTFGIYDANGGGAGGNNNGAGNLDGGSGGGGAIGGSEYIGGTAIPSTQGKNGGNGDSSSPYHYAGGGGGYGSVGGKPNGGSGVSVNFTGVPMTYACGGGGGAYTNPGGTGGCSYAGNGNTASGSGYSATNGTGSGGGGCGLSSSLRGGNGGSGIIMLLYQTPIAPPPSAYFSATPLSGHAPLSVSFSDSSINNPTSWFWDFGDGNFTGNMTQSPSHLYTTNGVYTVSLSVGNAQGNSTLSKANYIVAMNASELYPSFTAIPTSGVVPLSVQFIDNTTSYNATIDSWLWKFGDGNISSSQNPLYTYNHAGTYFANLTVTNASFSISNTTISQEISVHNSVGFNLQNTVLTQTYIVTIKLTSTATGLPILDATITDDNGQMVTTSNGTASFTEQYGVMSGAIYATGYAPRSFSAVIDNDTTITYQMNPQTTSNYSSIQYTTPHNVKITVRDVFAGPLPNVLVNATYVEASGPFEWLFSWIGVISQSNANVQNTTLSAHTGSDGAVNFLMVEAVQYRIEAVNQSMLIYPKDDDYTIWANGGLNASALYGSNNCDPLNQVRVGSGGWKINSTAGYLNVTYLDTLGKTNSVTINVTRTNHYGNITNETVLQTATISSQGFTQAFVIGSPADKSYNVHVIANTSTCGNVYRDFAVTFPPNPITLGFPEPLLPYIAMGMMIFVALCFVRTMPGETVIGICFIGWVTFLMHWWDSQVDPIVFGAALTGFSALAIIYNVALRSKKMPMQ